MKYVVYTDGSSRGNPGKSGWATIIMSELKVREYGGHTELATNNQMEAYAVLFAMKFALMNLNKEDSDEDEIGIYSDSEYVVKGVNTWVYNWSKNNWKSSTKKDVLNKELWKEIWKAINDMQYKKIKCKVFHVRGHEGHVFNERADVICTSLADNKAFDFYNGDLDSYEDMINTKQDKIKDSVDMSF